MTYLNQMGLLVFGCLFYFCFLYPQLNVECNCHQANQIYKYNNSNFYHTVFGFNIKKLLFKFQTYFFKLDKKFFICHKIIFKNVLSSLV